MISTGYFIYTVSGSKNRDIDFFLFTSRVLAFSLKATAFLFAIILIIKFCLTPMAKQVASRHYLIPCHVHLTSYTHDNQNNITLRMRKPY